MSRVTLAACTATPFGSYLKSLGCLRLISEQADPEARGFWDGDTFALESKLGADEIIEFYLSQYQPTPILAPWNGGSGFYSKDNKEGIDAIAESSDPRFAAYRDAIAICQTFPEIAEGKGENEDERRTAILRRCRNLLADGAVEWLDATVGIAAEGKRSFAPVLGTGGNEGRLDYTNNFMSRIVGLLLRPGSRLPVRSLLENALFATETGGLQSAAAGQFDPGRAGGANQGPGISHETATNPWDFVLTLEGAVAWASGLYRRQGTAYRSVLCSPFTVLASTVGYGSASRKEREDARAEIWAPLWSGPATYSELRNLLREGRASVQGRPASSAIEFAEAVCSLGVDRGIDRFVRYGLLKRRGDSYVALPAGTFRRRYRKESDLVRELQEFTSKLIFPKGADELARGIDAAIYQLLLTGGRHRTRELMSALGRTLRRLALSPDLRLPGGRLNASRWLNACGFSESAEVRIAAALASIFTANVNIGSMAVHLSRTDKRFAWTGNSLPDRLISVLERRLQIGTREEIKANPLGSACALRPGDATLFIEAAVDDTLIEELLFAFTALNWRDFTPIDYEATAEVLPLYALLKHFFLPGLLLVAPDEVRLRADPRIIALLKAGDIQAGADLAVHRLRVAKLRPLDVSYAGGVDPGRLAASLLIPVRQGRALASAIFHPREKQQEQTANSFSF